MQTSDTTITRWLILLFFAIVGMSGLTQYAAAFEPTTTIHEFPDGFIERSVAVTFEDMTATIEYSVGCSPNTMLDLMKRWDQREDATGPDSNALDDATSAASESGSLKSNDTPTAPKVGNDLPELTPKQISEIEARFRSRLGAFVAENLTVILDKTPTKLEPPRVEISPRHHIKATVVLEVEFEDESTVDFIIKDKLFRDNESAFRYAAKAKGDAMLLQSNVSPILVRAERVESKSLTSKQLDNETEIVTRVSFWEN